MLEVRLLRAASIEVCTACNHRCIYCPVSEHPFSQAYMSLEDYYLIISKLGPLHLERVSLNHYNEPFMDHFIIERIVHLAESKVCCRILLNTNAELITYEQLEALHPFLHLLDFNINLPTVVSEERYQQLHGRGKLHHIVDNIDCLLAMQFQVRLNVQCNQYTSQEDIESIRQRFPSTKIEALNSNTRAGLVFNSFVNKSDKIIGCRLNRDTTYFHVAINGDAFLCCQDYFKNYVFGNLITQSLSDVLNNEKRNQYLAYISGEQIAPSNFICRSCEFAIYAPISESK